MMTDKKNTNKYQHKQSNLLLINRQIETGLSDG